MIILTFKKVGAVEKKVGAKKRHGAVEDTCRREDAVEKVGVSILEEKLRKGGWFCFIVRNKIK
jgi:hypothetical protein